MADYELIGQKLTHSVSKPVHEALGAYQYALQELPDEQALATYLKERRFKGCNVTIPYKQAVLPLLDKIDDRAARIGAVNTIVNHKGRLTGYNTDYDGFAWLLAHNGISLAGQRVLLLGSGGTSKTVATVARDADAKEILVASRNPAPGQISYQQAMKRLDVDVIINVSPAGMYPNNGQSLVVLERFPQLAAVVDVVYNPLKTKLLLDAEARGIPAVGGLGMLVQQAVVAAGLFVGRPFAQADTLRVLAAQRESMVNLVLVGMPSSGKSKLGRAVARKLKKPFVDVDHLVEEQSGKTIPELFAQGGEALFRPLETTALAGAAKETGQVISTGGGVVTRAQNHPLMRQNGVVLYICRPLQQLIPGGERPLSTSMEALEKLYIQRAPLYEAVADVIVENDAPFMQVVHKILEAYHAFFGS